MGCASGVDVAEPDWFAPHFDACRKGGFSVELGKREIDREELKGGWVKEKRFSKTEGGKGGSTNL